jgi:serine protease Do
MPADITARSRGWREDLTAPWIAAFAALAAVILLLVALLVWRQWAAASDGAPDPELQARLAKNEELEEQVAELRATPAPACKAAPAQGQAQRAAPAAEPAAAAPPAGDTLSNRELVALLNEATALVLTEGGGASGFFIAPDLLVTNRHAVEGPGHKVFVTSKTLGHLHRGKVLAASAGSDYGAPDFALVQVEGGPGRRSLAFSVQIEPLMPVIAAGYPGLTIVHDSGFRALLGGDITAAPELVLNRGEVQAIQRSPHGLEVVAHSTRILQGNSGGPLVDGCGRVVGINTYAAVDARQAGQVSYAIAAGELTRFLAEHGAQPSMAESSCGG